MALGGSRTRIDIAGGRFAGLGLKTGGVRCGRMAVLEDTWRHREACVEAKRSCEGGMSVRWPDKMLDGFTPKSYLACTFNGGCFGHWPGRLHIEIYREWAV